MNDIAFHRLVLFAQGLGLFLILILEIFSAVGIRALFSTEGLAVREVNVPVCVDCSPTKFTCDIGCPCTKLTGYVEYKDYTILLSIGDFLNVVVGFWLFLFAILHFFNRKKKWIALLYKGSHPSSFSLHIGLILLVTLGLILALVAAPKKPDSCDGSDFRIKYEYEDSQGDVCHSNFHKYCDSDESSQCDSFYVLTPNSACPSKLWIENKKWLQEAYHQYLEKFNTDIALATTSLFITIFVVLIDIFVEAHEGNKVAKAFWHRVSGGRDPFTKAEKSATDWVLHTKDIPDPNSKPLQTSHSQRIIHVPSEVRLNIIAMK